MYPHVVQFETRRQQFADERRLIRERRRVLAGAGDAGLERAPRASGAGRRKRDISAYVLRVVAVMTGGGA
jgi:hypothetical protein